ncbi:MAG: hypothetical protein SGBAC_010017 [Bacillariaceae sp.]
MSTQQFTLVEQKLAFPQHQHLIRLSPPPPPPPPHSHHSHHKSSSGSNTYSGSSNGGGSYNGGSSGGGGGMSNNAYPYKMENLTAYSGLMFLAVGVLIARIFNFFRQNCTKLEHSKRQGYLGVNSAQTVSANFVPFRDNPSLRNRKGHQAPPSPKHPAISNVPPKAINIETMKRLQTTGIRMMAHGVHCDPRKVWLTIDESSINWQSEFQREVPDVRGNLTMVPVRGSLHRIHWNMIEYIDVGKRTDALKQATHVAGHLCFSLLTQEGSLDLQANSQLERDTLVSCIGLKLDELLGGEWRQLAPVGTTPSSTGVSSASGAFSNSSFSTINQPFPDYSVDI